MDASETTSIIIFRLFSSLYAYSPVNRIEIELRWTETRQQVESDRIAIRQNE